MKERKREREKERKRERKKERKRERERKREGKRDLFGKRNKYFANIFQVMLEPTDARLVRLFLHRQLKLQLRRLPESKRNQLCLLQHKLGWRKFRHSARKQFQLHLNAKLC